MVSVAGFALRVGYAFVYQRHTSATGDAFYYHFQANLLVAGKAFINPYVLLFYGRSLPNADHPPMFTLVLALGSSIGLKSYFSQILWTCGIGAIAVFVVGLAAREIAGTGASKVVASNTSGPAVGRAGLIAAGIAALYPVFIINDGALMSESLVLLTTALVVLCFFRFWNHPSFGRGVWLGVSCAVAALTRSEFVLVIPFLVVPMVFMRWRGVPIGRRLGLVTVVSLAVLTTFAPWWAYNATRFKDPVLLSDQLGVTLVTANCTSTYYGSRIGYWAFACGQQLGVHTSPTGDPSVEDYQLRRIAVGYMEKHDSRLPVVMAARLGRELGLFAPIQQINFEWQALHRPRLPAFFGLGVYYLAALLAVPGAVILRKRGVTLLPFVAILADTVLVCVATFGQTRYRTSLDVAIVILASVTLAELSNRKSLRRSHCRHLSEMSIVGRATGWKLRASTTVDADAADPRDDA